ncbi:DUF3089 domain-containing protein [Sphingomonas oligophenolica]|uniref:DUF3089 domain-containing protein n=1 Tax=Sphingomonas oligophenolica TaxID=301154 RepID=A0A502C272_9SPHN|nr:DUF3089 domain-containing protein [Sphingomonas oligophenolica]TPG05846.1 DUF3089 domain-containing protein [Sphingomonas oligophenolica]
MHKSWIVALAATLTVPAGAQTAASPSPTPDYTQDAAWLCRPSRADACAANLDVTVVRADGKQTVERFRPAAAPAFDCFYVYPTVSNDPTPNSDITAGPEEQAVATAQAARFASKCRVFAPLYRQVTLTALRQTMTGGAPAVDRAMALADVTAAWKSYLARDNKGRGVVLIGHSQGSGLLKQMIAQTLEGSSAQRNVISAILLGTNVAVPAGKAVGGDLKQMPICTQAGQYGCVVTYVTFRADSPPPANSRFGKVPQPGMVAACVNPVALLGPKAANDAIFNTKGPGMSSAAQPAWSSVGPPVTTPFVKAPGLISTECVSRDGFSYLAVTVNADLKDPRTDRISGDVVVGGSILKDWGLHLLDNSVTMGNLVELTGVQAKAWRGVGLPSK